MDQQYLNLLQDVLSNGVQRPDRTGTGTLSVFGRMYRHNLDDGFPLLTTKKLHIKSILLELLWFLQGSDDISYLQQNGVTIWNEWAHNQKIGPLYGPQWRAWPGRDGKPIDQVTALVEGIKRNPNSRRHIINAWNVAYLPDETKSPQENVQLGNMCLAPCPTLMQWYVAEGKLNCMLTQRSADLFLGCPYNTASVSFFKPHDSSAV